MENNKKRELLIRVMNGFAEVGEKGSDLYSLIDEVRLQVKDGNIELDNDNDLDSITKTLDESIKDMDAIATYFQNRYFKTF